MLSTSEVASIVDDALPLPMTACTSDSKDADEKQLSPETSTSNDRRIASPDADLASMRDDCGDFLRCSARDECHDTANSGFVAAYGPNDCRRQCDEHSIVTDAGIVSAMASAAEKSPDRGIVWIELNRRLDAADSSPMSRTGSPCCQNGTGYDRLTFQTFV
jgi:hypothetical protein